MSFQEFFITDPRVKEQMVVAALQSRSITAGYDIGLPEIALGIFVKITTLRTVDSILVTHYILRYN